MSEMFANCTNLISINNISKLKKTKIINQYKMFYNCTSLLSIPDIHHWEILEDIDNYLMFYNCISLIFFPNSVLEKIYDIEFEKQNYIDLGILFTKHLQNGKEILLKTVIDNNRKIELFGNELIIKKNDVIYLMEVNTTYFYSIKKKMKIKKNDLIVYYQNEIKPNFKEKEIILKVINKLNIGIFFLH